MIATRPDQPATITMLTYSRLAMSASSQHISGRYANPSAVVDLVIGLIYRTLFWKLMSVLGNYAAKLAR